MDKYNRETRSRMMASVRSKGNKSTEQRLRAYLVNAGITGWRVNPRDIHGKPDFVFDNLRLAIFVDGCFWHGCSQHCRMPATRQEYWVNKIEGNRQRDIIRSKELRQQGWHVLRFWEHRVKNSPQNVIKRIHQVIECLHLQHS